MVDPSLAFLYVLMLCMAVFSLTIGVYLIFTNPPESKDKFIGIGAKKLSDEELE